MKELTLEMVCDYINSETAYSASICEVTKPNKVIKGLQVTANEEERVTPIFYEWILDGAESCEEVFLRIVSTERNTNPVEHITMEAIEENLHKVIFRVVKYEGNEAIVNKYAGRKFLDLYVYYSIPVAKDGTSVASVPIMMEFNTVFKNVTEDDLFDMAMTNLEDSFNVFNMYPFVAVTNKDSIYGASQILNTRYLSDLASKLSSDLVILPSSIHEVLVVTTSFIEECNMNREKLCEMITSINASEVKDVEVLNDHPYLFTRETGKVTIY